MLNPLLPLTANEQNTLFSSLFRVFVLFFFLFLKNDQRKSMCIYRSYVSPIVSYLSSQNERHYNVYICYSRVKVTSASRRLDSLTDALQDDINCCEIQTCLPAVILHCKIFAISSRVTRSSFSEPERSWAGYGIVLFLHSSSLKRLTKPALSPVCLQVRRNSTACLRTGRRVLFVAVGGF